MNAPTDNKITSIDLSEVQLARLRILLFEELHEVAKILVEQAADAIDGGNTDSHNVAGDDAHGTYRRRMDHAAELLDKVGWSVLTDTATIVEFERSRRVV